MKFVTVRDLRGRSGQAWKDLARERDLGLTSNGKPVAILSAVSEQSLLSTGADQPGRKLSATPFMQ